MGARRLRTVLVAGAVTGVVFQLAHFGEHVAQTGYWVTHRSEPPWVTPWARTLIDSYRSWAPGSPGFGMELLHLVGNAIFLTGALAICLALAPIARSGDVRLARIGTAVQVVHVAEHIALTTTVVVAGRSIGVSTLFGTIDAGPAVWTYRIWWHMAINAIATLLLAVALARHARAHAMHHPAPPTALANRSA